MTTPTAPHPQLLPIVARDLWHLDHDLAGTRERRLLEDVARWFPAALVTQAGIELALPGPTGGERATLDLSLCIERTAPGAAILAGHTGTPLPPPLFRDPTWQALRAFATRWASATDGPFAAIPLLWLAFPQPELPGRIPVPGITFGVADGTAPADALAVLDAIGVVAPGVARAGREPLARVLGQVRRAPAYLAVFPARSATALRVELGVRAGEITDLLAAVGWPGDPGRLAQLVTWAARGDIVRLAFDLDRAVGPRVGIALGSTGHWAHRIVRQYAMVAALADAGACSPRAAERTASSLRRAVEVGPDGGRVLVQVGLSHVKATLEADGSVRAKAYAGTLRHPLPPAASAAPDRLADARRRAVAFLLAAQDPAGAWRGLVDLGGPATAWVTAHTAHALALDGSPRALAAARRGWRWLLAQPHAAGWQYTGMFEPDADTTTWTLRLGDALGLLDRPEHTGFVDLLAPFATADGAGLRPFARFLGNDVASTPQLAGYDQVHLCITAASASLPGASPRFLDTLRQAQMADGSWFPHWWPDHEYATAFAVEALVRNGDAADAERLGWAGAWLRGRLGEEGAARAAVTGEPSPFATALAAFALALLGEPAATRAGVWLAAAQLPDGSWAASDWQHRWSPADTGTTRPPATRMIPALRDGETLVVDGTGIFTTATALRALARA